MTGRTQFRRSAALGLGLVLTAVLALISVPAAPAEAGTRGWSPGVESWVTDFSTDQRLSAQPLLRWQRGSGPVGATITVDPDRRYQQMTGFGASMTDSSAYVLSKLPTKVRRTIMKQLFSPTDGIGLSMLRQPMGASDFAVAKAYSYDDQPKGEIDPDLSDFSIQHDRAYILPRLREAYRHNRELSFMASPWSAPGWMKTSDSMITGSLLPQYQEAYAQYFVKFVKAYRKAGIPTDFVSVNNEPLYEPANYPGMLVYPPQAASFIAGSLGPALRRAGLDRTAILAYDHNWDVPDYPEMIYNTPAAAYTPGTAWHCYAGSVVAQSVSHNNFPHAQSYLTECSGGTWQEDPFALTMSSVIGVPRNWGQSVVLWNLALDRNRGPFIGGCDTCRGVVTVDTDRGTVSKEVEYYALGHAAKFVRPGAVRIGSSSLGPSDAALSENGVSNVAYENPDGSQVMVAYNASTATKTFAIQVGDRHVAASLAAGAAATYRWRAPRGVRCAADLGYVDLDLGRGPVGTPTGRLTQSVSGDVVNALSQVKIGNRWLGYSTPYGSQLLRTGTATTLSRTGWSLSASNVTPVDKEPLTNMIDGSPATRWSSGQGQDKKMSVTLDLGHEQTFSEIELDARASIGDYLRRYTVQTSTDGRTWTDIARGDGHSGVTTILLPPTTTRYLRLASNAEAGSWWSIHELNLRSVSPATDPVVGPDRSLRHDEARMSDGTRVVGWYNGGSAPRTVPWPIAGFGYTYRLPPTAAVTFTLRPAS